MGIKTRLSVLSSMGDCALCNIPYMKVNKNMVTRKVWEKDSCGSSVWKYRTQTTYRCEVRTRKPYNSDVLFGGKSGLESGMTNLRGTSAAMIITNHILQEFLVVNVMLLLGVNEQWGLNPWEIVIAMETALG